MRKEGNSREVGKEISEMGIGSKGHRDIVREELQRDKSGRRAGRRAWAYEKRLDRGRSELGRQ